MHLIGALKQAFVPLNPLVTLAKDIINLDLGFSSNKSPPPFLSFWRNPSLSIKIKVISLQNLFDSVASDVHAVLKRKNNDSLWNIYRLNKANVFAVLKHNRNQDETAEKFGNYRKNRTVKQSFSSVNAFEITLDLVNNPLEECRGHCLQKVEFYLLIYSQM